MQQNQNSLPFYTLLVLISFASVNAVLFTPGLPSIASFFALSSSAAQQTVTWFLIGYAVGQLLYGPVANRYGRKPALYLGIGLQIISSLLCVGAGSFHLFSLLVVSRFFMALGSGVGLKMTFTLVSECYDAKLASQKIAYLMLAFAITPGLAVALGGFLNQHYGWSSCFYAGAVYGLILLILVTRLPETKKNRDLAAFKLTNLIEGYSTQFKNSRLLAGGLLMGGSTSFVYVFAALAPFLAIDLFGMSSSEYGLANILPPIGLILGSLTSARLAKTFQLEKIIRAGLLITAIGIIFMTFAVLSYQAALVSLFLPMIIIYFGLALVLANASTVAMGQVKDKAHGSAVMNFINMGLATVSVLALGFFTIKLIILPSLFIILWVLMGIVYQWLTRNDARTGLLN